MNRMRRHFSEPRALRRLIGLVLVAALQAAASGCRSNDAPASASRNDSASATTPGVTPAAKPPVADSFNRTQLVLGSTTSTEDSGLFGVLIPAFEKSHPRIAVRVVAVGTGQALEMGRRKDADVLLVHAPAAENEFVSKGYGEKRCLVMYNDFVIIGPKSDPAHINGLKDAVEAFARISRSGTPFISRGDDSGTDKKEKSLWEEAHIRPAGTWYMSTGQGMGEVLNIASEKNAYTLTDRGTHLSVKDHNALDVLVEGDRRLLNQYGVIPVTGARNLAGAEEFAKWITSPEGQHVIADFGVAKFGQSLFIPNANGC